MFCQIATKATAGRASDGSVNHSILTPSTWFNAPAEGWKIHFHTTPSARGALTHGITTTTRTRAEPGTARTSWVASPSPSASDTGTDRKSTRLNSSHVAISYAVFCLKKKNTSD